MNILVWEMGLENFQDQSTALCFLNVLILEASMGGICSLRNILTHVLNLLGSTCWLYFCLRCVGPCWLRWSFSLVFNLLIFKFLKTYVRMSTITPLYSTLLECPKLYFKQVKEDQVKQMDIENSFITKWKDTQVSSNS
jgi:hypothetical protein